MDGKGNLITVNLKYSGSFKKDKFDGIGLLLDSEGNIYDGEFIEGMKQGVGKLNFANKDLYVGNFKDNLFDGR